MPVAPREKDQNAYYRAQLSKSRVMTATCARLTASATSVKSLRNGSADDALSCAGGGATIFVGDCCVDVAVECGEDIGASIATAISFFPPCLPSGSAGDAMRQAQRR